MSDVVFTLLGDAIWLDFINTARGRIAPPPDLLLDDAAMGQWTLAQRLHSDGDAPPLQNALRLRDHLTALAEALHQGLAIGIEDSLHRGGSRENHECRHVRGCAVSATLEARRFARRKKHPAGV